MDYQSVAMYRRRRRMCSNGLLSSRQFGFVSGRSTMLQLLNVLDEWTTMLETGGSVDVVYLDFMKAFDTVPYRRLLAKAEGFGIANPLLKWIESFLVGRKQRVCVNGAFSDWADVTSGIPQGSVLGPLLFVMYINDLPELVSSSSVYLFADDTKIFKHVENENDAAFLQKDLQSLVSWSEKWLLKFHPDKCCVVSIGDHDEPHDYTMSFQGIPHNLSHVDSSKDLGVIIDSKLGFDQHFQSKINKANSLMYLIRRTFVYLHKENFLLLYKALIRPHLEYAHAVWSPYLKKHIQALENVQRRATKLVPEIKALSYEQRLFQLSLPTLAYRRARGDMIETYKLFHRYDQEVVPDLGQVQGTTRGHSKKIYIPRSVTEKRKNSFYVRMRRPWNSLSEDLVNAPSVYSFENGLDK